MDRLKSTFFVAKLVLAIGLALPGSAGAASEPATPVVLTFNVETDEDAAALAAQSRKFPATYFITGAFAERHEALVRELASRGTIGSLSYSHPDLSTLGEEALHRELQLGRLVLEKAAGAPVKWFRAPFLQSNEAVVRAVEKLGFLYDSSEQERWTRQLSLFELPVSNEDGGEKLASDYDLFGPSDESATGSVGLTNAAALAWLQRRFDERAVTGRPLVVMLRPRILAQRPQLLDDFLDLIEQRGGELLSADQYVERTRAPQPQRYGVWVDFSQGAHDAAQLARDVAAAGFTDVYLQAKDPEGNRYYANPADGGPVASDAFTESAAALKDSGVRVHAWIVVGRDPYLAGAHPEWAMTNIAGVPSREWLSPSVIPARAAVLRTVGELLDRFPLHGVHLDYLRYPDLDHDFSPANVEAFRAAEGIGELPLRAMFDGHYNAWIRWRSEQIRALTEEIEGLVHARRGEDVELSAALYADAATSYRVMETMGQDYTLLARHLDTLIPMAYVQEQHRTVPWIEKVALAARFRAGNRPVLAGLEAFQRPGKVTYTPQLFGEGITAALHGYDGLVFYAYSYLFGRGKAEQNLPAGSLERLIELRPEIVATPASSSSSSASGQRWSFPRIIYVVLAVVFLAAAALAARGRALRAQRARRASGRRATSAESDRAP